jgi:quercetin dioxygenase-like cupin family protein
MSHINSCLHANFNQPYLNKTIGKEQNMLTKGFFARILLLIAALVLWSVAPALAQEHPSEHPKAKTEQEHPTAMAPDPVKAAPQAFTEKLNNAHVRVLEYHSKPGDKEAMHSHPAVVIYIISGGKFKSTTPDGKSQETEYKTGDVVWREAMTHSGENIGTTEIHAILVEMKTPMKMEKETKK